MPERRDGASLPNVVSESERRFAIWIARHHMLGADAEVLELFRNCWDEAWYGAGGAVLGDNAELGMLIMQTLEKFNAFSKLVNEFNARRRADEDEQLSFYWRSQV